MTSSNVSLDDENLRSNRNKLYIPSAIERKRVSMVYTIIGIFFLLQKKNFTVYEYYHFKQAIGWGLVMIVYLILSVVLFFLPIIKRIAMLGLFVMIVFWGLMIKQAWDGKYIPFIKKQTYREKQYQFFVFLGQRILDIFDIESKINVIDEK